ncbi:MAG TPA: type 1 glutamine amidotransferase domain-containing protein [Synergistales bacterium]|jgi:protease I|nr:type 1 glutamine amidotransferase [Synergistaceae bacterium]HOO86706.1 type 1 glutamine amidotransferase domain-containing protein [Synergistales bacterium]HRV97431.1 type 1 glutamine amidotransferase domain-containing protein [Aminobacteriaceae bacterium]MDD3915928.1 type 1 glutamine amidotransferase [Synergistaceae bacterium]NLD95744.1 type 1 glutamine amidotransferase [Synergistaceae bacterium]
MSKKIAVLTEETIHDLEFWYPYYRLAEEGYDLVIVGPEAGKSYTGKMGGVIRSEKSPSEISAKDFAGVVVPGGWGPDKLRTHKAIVDFVRDVHANGGVVAAICHGGSVLVSARILEGVRATSYKSIKDDMILAGAEWVDEAVVVSKNIVTSRTPSDLAHFGKALVETLKKIK